MNTKTQFVKWETPGSENTVRGKHAQPFLTSCLQLAMHAQTTVVMVNTKCSRITKQAVRKLLQCIVEELKQEDVQCAVNNSQSVGRKTLIAKCKKLKCKI